MKKNIAIIIEILNDIDKSYEDGNFNLDLLNGDRYKISLNRLYLLLEMIIDANLVTGISLNPPMGFGGWSVSDSRCPRLTFYGLQFLLENS